MTGAELKAARKEAGLTQVQLGAAIEMTQSMIAQWETGKVVVSKRDELAIKSVLATAKVKAKNRKKTA